MLHSGSDGQTGSPMMMCREWKKTQTEMIYEEDDGVELATLWLRKSGGSTTRKALD